jgi:hypothetical protein
LTVDHPSELKGLSLDSAMKTLVTPLLERDDAVPFTVDLFDGLGGRQFVDLMDRHKALLFHGDGGGRARTTEDFGRFVAGLQLEGYPYVGGAAPRTIIPVSAGKDIVFTANERSVSSSDAPFRRATSRRRDSERLGLHFPSLLFILTLP